jgi:hypothetical protein
LSIRKPKSTTPLVVKLVNILDFEAETIRFAVLIGVRHRIVVSKQQLQMPRVLFPHCTKPVAFSFTMI